MTTHAAVAWTNEGSLTLIEKPTKPPSKDEVTVQVQRVGICGSDLHFYRGDLPTVPGVTPGHEFAGTVTAVGSNVAKFKEGDRVGVEPLLRCGICDFCLTSDYHVCNQRRLVGESQDGGMSQFVNVPAQISYPLPQGLGFEGGALAEPLACSVHAFRKVHLQGHETVFILGAGTIGLTAILAARSVGAHVIVQARHAHQKAAAKALGANEVLTEDDQSQARLKELAAINAIDVAVETVGGRAETLWQAQQVLRSKGKLIVIGVFTGGPVPINALHLMVNEIEIIGSMTYNASDGYVDYSIALDVVNQFQNEAGTLVTHRFDLSDVTKAFETAADKSTKCVKVHFNPTQM